MRIDSRGALSQAGTDRTMHPGAGYVGGAWMADMEHGSCFLRQKSVRSSGLRSDIRVEFCSRVHRDYMQQFVWNRPGGRRTGKSESMRYRVHRDVERHESDVLRKFC